MEKLFIIGLISTIVTVLYVPIILVLAGLFAYLQEKSLRTIDWTLYDEYNLYKGRKYALWKTYHAKDSYRGFTDFKSLIR